MARQLAEARPKDSTVTGQLSRYKGADPQWHDWAAVRKVAQEIAGAMTTSPPAPGSPPGSGSLGRRSGKASK